MLSDVTIGITTFDRPVLLERLVASVIRRYPSLPLIVADNGKQHAVLPERIQHLKLPFDCGLSSARNALANACRTRYLLLLDDDFLFTDMTRIDQLVDVLDCDAEVGVVGGAMRGRLGRVSAYSMDIEVFRSVMYVREVDHRIRFTSNGVPYRLCDMVWNFALYRREMLKQHRWHDRLKIGEHAPYFHSVKQAGEWRVACCPSVVCDHLPDVRTAGYQKFRGRAKHYFQSYLKEVGLKDYRRIVPQQAIDEQPLKPNIIVLGVGHSGTTILTRMLHALGWEPFDADDEFAESVSLRRLNMEVRRTGRLNGDQAGRILATMPTPWALKDPRFVMTLHHWLPYLSLLQSPPTLLRIVRDRASVRQSYLKRGLSGDVEQMLDARHRLCCQQYERWPWDKMTVEYERLIDAVKIFDPGRATAEIVSSPPPVPIVHRRPQGIESHSREIDSLDIDLVQTESFDSHLTAFDSHLAAADSLELPYAPRRPDVDDGSGYLLEGSSDPVHPDLRTQGGAYRRPDDGSGES